MRLVHQRLSSIAHFDKELANQTFAESNIEECSFQVRELNKLWLLEKRH